VATPPSRLRPILARDDGMLFVMRGERRTYPNCEVPSRPPVRFLLDLVRAVATLRLRMRAGAAVTVHVPSALRKYCSGASDLPVSAPTVRAALDELEREYPSLYRNICNETGAVRRHLNVFVNSSHISDRDALETALAPGDVVTILAAVSGG
jgi:sulfur-carrier protein